MWSSGPTLIIPIINLYCCQLTYDITCHIALINTQFLLHPQLGMNYFEEITRGTFYPESSLLNIILRIENRPTLNEKNNGIRDRRDSGRLTIPHRMREETGSRSAGTPTVLQEW